MAAVFLAIQTHWLLNSGFCCHIAARRHQNCIQTPRIRHSLILSTAYSGSVMRGAFVVQLSTPSKPAQGQLEGWVEEVDSGKQLKFRSTLELLTFIAERMLEASWSGEAEKK